MDKPTFASSDYNVLQWLVNLIEWKIRSNSSESSDSSPLIDWESDSMESFGGTKGSNNLIEGYSSGSSTWKPDYSVGPVKVDSSAVANSITGTSDVSDSVGSGSDEEVPNWFSGLLQSVGQSQAQDRIYNAEQAALSREWSERMSNTAYQREVKDLQAAGLNPILAVTGGGLSGASTPSSATATHSSSSGDTLSTLISALASLASSVADFLPSITKNFSQILNLN